MSVANRLRAFSFLAAGCALMSLPIFAQSADCTHSALVKGEEGRYSIVLENNCSAPVKWSYNACAFGQSLESGTATVGSGQTFQTGFSYDLLGTPQLLEHSCEGLCLNDLLSCSVASTITPSPEPLQDPAILFPKTGTQTTSEPQLKPLSELLAEKPQSETSIIDSLTLKDKPTAEPKPVLKPLDELLAEKPTTTPRPVFTPVPNATPKINAQTLPNNVGVQATVVPPGTPTPPKGVEYVASCVTSEAQPRNMFGQGKLELTNHCPIAQNVAVRICVAAQPDTHELLTVKANGKNTVSYKLPKNMTPRVSMTSCQGADCRPATPKACN